MLTAQSAAVRQDKPLQCAFECVAGAHSPEVDRFAMRAARGKHGSGRLSAAGGGSMAGAEGRRRIGGTAGIARGLDLFRSPDVGLGSAHAFPGARHLALVSFREPFIHANLQRDFAPLRTSLTAHGAVWLEGEQGRRVRTRSLVFRWG